MPQHGEQTAEGSAAAARPATEGTLVKVGPLAATGRLAGLRYGGATDRDRGAPPINLLGYWRVAVKHRRVMCWVIAMALAIGVLRFLLLTPVYSSAVRLQIDRYWSKIVERGNVAPNEGLDNEFLRTQYELLQTRSLAQRVVTRLALAEDAGFLAQKDASIFAGVPAWSHGLFLGETATSKEAAAIALVLERRQVRPVPGSRLVDVVFSDTEPVRAQRIAAAYGDAFIASGLEKRLEVNAYAKAFLEEQLRQVKGRLEQSERVLVELAQKEEIIVVNERSGLAEGNLAAANATLGVIAAERIRNEQLWRQADASSVIALPQFLVNAVIEGLRARRNVLTTEYEEKLETFKPAYPAMVQIKNKIAEIDRQTAIEVVNVKASLKAAFDASSVQEAKTRVRIEELRADMLDLQKRSIPYTIAKREVDTNRSLYDALLARTKDVDVAGGVTANTVFVVDAAQVPPVPSSPGVVRTLLVSLALGLGVAAFVAFVMEQMDDTVRSLVDAERETGLALLGVVPVTRGALDQGLAPPASGVFEAYRSLAAALAYSATAGLPRSLLVTSAGAREGKSVTAVALARVFAQQGMTVLLIDADLRAPSLHRRFGVSNGVGLTRVLSGDAMLDQANVATDLGTLRLMTSGPLGGDASALLAGGGMARLLAVASSFDLVVVDGPPVMTHADAPLLARAVEGVVFVVAAGQGRTGAIRDSVARLEFAQAGLVGCVLTKFDASRAGHAGARTGGREMVAARG